MLRQMKTYFNKLFKLENISTKELAVRMGKETVVTIDDIKSFSIEKDLASDTAKRKQLIAFVKLHPNTVTYMIKHNGDIVTITFDVLNAIDYYNKI